MIARCRSLSERRLVFDGKSGSMKNAMMAHPQVAAPSTICQKKLVPHFCDELAPGLLTKSHSQPVRPWTPSRLLSKAISDCGRAKGSSKSEAYPVMAPAMMPPKAPDNTAAEMYTANRFDCSSFLYHDDKMSKIPGAKPASRIPTIVLSATSCP